MTTEPRHNLILLLNEPCFRLRIVNVVTASSVARDNVFAAVQIRNETDCYLTAFGPAFDEIITFVIQVVEQRPGNCLKDSGFACAIGAADRDDSGLKRPFPFGVILNVL